MDNIDLRMYLIAVYSGCYLDFKFVGQIVPNNDKVNLEYGCKIFIDYETSELKRKKIIELNKSVFGKQLVDKLTSIESKIMRNRIAGYISRVKEVKKQEKSENEQTD